MQQVGKHDSYAVTLSVLTFGLIAVGAAPDRNCKWRVAYFSCQK
jgi:hypothetical protein